MGQRPNAQGETLSISTLSDPNAVLAAIHEYDELGAEEFLRKYGFGRAKSYRLVHEGRTYDSKAIAGVAVGKQFPDRGPMTSTDFTGGTPVRQKLVDLGFEVDTGDGVASLLPPDAAYAFIVEQWGQPTAETSKLSVWRTPAGRELALNREGVSTRIWLELEPPPATDRSTLNYPSHRSRHSNLKRNAPRLAEPFVSYLSTVSSEAALDDLLDWYAGQSADELDPQQLESLKSTFLRQMPGFHTFEESGDVYEPQERAYKDELRTLFLNEVAPLLAARPLADETAADITSAIHGVMKRPLETFGRSPQNLVSWRTIDRIKPTGTETDAGLGRAYADLLTSNEDVVERLGRFVRTISESLNVRGASVAADDARVIGSCLLMLQDPNSALVMRWQVFDQALQLLRRQRMGFGEDEQTRFRRGLDMVRALRRHMDNVWGWKARDLIDVQSFLWVALKYDEKDEESFGLRLEQFVKRFGEVRETAFRRDDTLWDLGERVCERIRGLDAVKSRPDIVVDWSVGKGVWANVPWIALLNRNVTQTTQDGVYVVFLISQDLSRVYLNLAQGVTRVVDQLGQTEGAAALVERAERYRRELPELITQGFELSSDVELGGTGWRARSYEVSTIAKRSFEIGSAPSDAELNVLLEAVLSAYDKLVGHDTDEERDAKPTYTLEDALEGVFMARDEFERILGVWSNKRNLILQGAPGVGKSFIARRLAYALMGEKAPGRVEAVQFHQSYGYEDFIQGYRPTDTGGFELRDGIFYRFCKKALEDPENAYVIVIDEINRGNLSKIFGELMLLIEHDKRSKEWATRLAYAGADEEPFWIPENVYILGMMNTADRSLSLVDYALRRRFAFVTLAPAFANPAFSDFLSAAGVPTSTINQIVTRMLELNREICEDTANLGAGFQIGHSFFVPSPSFKPSNDWLTTIVDTEIRPLLEEYWFDAPDKATHWRQRLLE